MGDLPQNQERFVTLINEGEGQRKREATKKESKREEENVKESAWNGITRFVFALGPNKRVGYLTHSLLISFLFGFFSYANVTT